MHGRPGHRHSQVVGNVKLTDWFKQLSRGQVGVLGGIAGYSIGILTGPSVRILVAIGLVVVFALVGKHLDEHFEARLGAMGIAAAISATYVLEPVRHALSGYLGSAIAHASKLGLAFAGVIFALRLHENLLADTAEDLDDSDY